MVRVGCAELLGLIDTDVARWADMGIIKEGVTVVAWGWGAGGAGGAR